MWPYLHLGAMICMFAWIIYDPGLLALSAEVRFFKALGQNMAYPDGLLNQLALEISRKKDKNKA